MRTLNEIKAEKRKLEIRKNELKKDIEEKNYYGISHYKVLEQSIIDFQREIDLLNWVLNENSEP